MTTWPGAHDRDWSGPGEHREIVQIGAVRLGPDGEELDALCLLVKPRINPVLSDYFIALTGVTQEEVDRAGLPFADALERLVTFAAPDLALVSNGVDCDVIAENCQLNALAYPFAGRGCNIEDRLQAAAGGKRVESGSLAAAFGLPFVGGRAHDALSDARNVAAVLRSLGTDGRLPDWVML